MKHFKQGVHADCESGMDIDIDVLQATPRKRRTIEIDWGLDLMCDSPGPKTRRLPRAPVAHPTLVADDGDGFALDLGDTCDFAALPKAESSFTAVELHGVEADAAIKEVDRRLKRVRQHKPRSRKKDCESVPERPMLKTAGEIQAALINVVGSQYTLFAELCCGGGAFTLALLKKVGHCIGVDWKLLVIARPNLLRIDLREPAVVSVMVFMIERDRCKGMGGGLRCHTFSYARRGKYHPIVSVQKNGQLVRVRQRPLSFSTSKKMKSHGFPVALRSKTELWGIARDRLSDSELQVLDSANASTKSFFHVMGKAVDHLLPVWMENPDPSMVWPLVEQEIIQKHGVPETLIQRLRTSQCLWGDAQNPVRWRKVTMFGDQCEETSKL